MVLVEDEDVVEDFMLARAARLSGRVVGPGGRALHAPVLLFLSGREQVSSDAQGAFDFAELAPGAFSVLALDPANGAVEQELELQPGEAREVTLELKTGGVVEGTVRHADGRVAVAATVHVGRNITVRTDGSGRYRMAGLHAGLYGFTVGEGSDVLASVDLRLREDEQRSGIDFTLAEGRHAIAGMVTDAAGEPVPNEEVTVTVGELRRRLRCGADGRFHADGLPDGAGQVALFDGREVIVVGFAEDDADVRVTLKRRALLRGTVVGARGRPIDSFQVELSGLDGPERAQSRDGAGRFELDGVIPGDYRLEVTAADGSFVSLEVTVTDAPVTDVTVRLEPPGEVIGRVVDRNGRPRSNVSVGGGVRSVQTGGDGTFRLAVRPGAVELSFAPDDENVVNDSRTVAVAAGGLVDVGAVTLIDQRPGGDDEVQGFDGMEAQNRDGQATVASVDPDSAAARAGIVAGDLLFAIDGNDVSGLGGGAIDELLRGTPGETVEVTFAHPDAPAQTVTLVLAASAQPND
jgi:hypothetical protein